VSTVGTNKRSWEEEEEEGDLSAVGTDEPSREERRDLSPIGTYIVGGKEEHESLPPIGSVGTRRDHSRQ